MALPTIDTGYKPEFGLGAVYQGFNAANAEQGAELELIKQFLANQREQSMQPLDVTKAQLTNEGMASENLIKAFQGAQAQSQNTPEMLKAFVDSTRAGYNKNIRQDQVDALLQPDKLRAASFQGQTMVDNARAGADMSGNQASAVTGVDRSGNVLSSMQRQAAQKAYEGAVPIMGNTPEFWGKNELENTKGWWHLEAAKQASDATRYAASVGGKAAWAQALPQVMGYVKSLEGDLTKLNNNEMGDIIAQKVATMGIPKGSPEYKAALETEKVKLRQDLNTQLIQARQQYQQVLMASGLMTGNPVAASTNSKVSGSGSNNNRAGGSPIGTPDNPIVLK